MVVYFCSFHLIVLLLISFDCTFAISPFTYLAYSHEVDIGLVCKFPTWRLPSLPLLIPCKNMLHVDQINSWHPTQSRETLKELLGGFIQFCMQKRLTSGLEGNFDAPSQVLEASWGWTATVISCLGNLYLFVLTVKLTLPSQPVHATTTEPRVWRTFLYHTVICKDKAVRLTKTLMSTSDAPVCLGIPMSVQDKLEFLLFWASGSWIKVNFFLVIRISRVSSFAECLRPPYLMMSFSFRSWCTGSPVSAIYSFRCVSFIRRTWSHLLNQSSISTVLLVRFSPPAAPGAYWSMTSTAIGLVVSGFITAARKQISLLDAIVVVYGKLFLWSNMDRT